MEKIKNWSKLGVNKGYPTWRHDKRNLRVFVFNGREVKSRDLPRGNGWFVVTTNRVGDIKKEIGFENTKEKAVERSVNWMRNHPGCSE